MASIPRNGRPPPRFFQWSTLPLLLFAALAVLSVNARSPHPAPLRRLHHPSARSLEILPRRKTDSIAHSINARGPFPHPRTLRHDDTFFLTLELPSLLPQPVHLLMKPTPDLFHPDAVIRYDSGVTEPLRAQDYRLYTGEVIKSNWKDRLYWEETTGLRDEWAKDGVMGDARIMVLHPGSMDVHPIFEGVFTVNGVHYNVLTKEHYDRVKTDKDVVGEEFEDMVVFRNADAWHDDSAQSTFSSCNHDDLPFNANASHPVRSGMTHESMLDTIFKRDDLGGMAPSSNYANSIGNPAGCPSTQQVVYMGVALDCNYVQTYGSTERAREQVLTVWNQVSALYRSTFNISLGIVELVVQNTTCPSQSQQGTEWDVSCDANLTLDQRLSLFSQWRGNRGDDGIGLWHLMSACPTDTEVGVAWLGTLCQTASNFQSGSYVSGTGISTATRTEWSLVAHEIGHGFGAIHDCTDGCSLSGGCCPLNTGSCNAGGRFIMNPTTSETEETFSQCTLGNVCSGLGARLVSSSCIESPGQRTTISLQQCGNGIVDDGEECDPGSNGDSTCCDPQTCKFRSGAVCDPSNSACCTDSCQYAAAGTVCRQAVQATCDFAETCTGNNATCPPDRTAEDGTSCGDGLQCASGRCTSLDQQCQTAGASMNLTRACGQRDDTSCVVACRDPRIPNQCVVLQTPLVDGSPCGYGGHCYNQTCQSGSWQDTAGAWYRQNLQISIPVTIVAGLLALGILFAIGRCIFRGCCCGTRRQNKPSQRQSMRQSGTGFVAPPPPQRHSDSSTAAMNPPPPDRRQSGYQNVPTSSPPRNGVMPPPPTHQYDYGNGGGQGYNGYGGYDQGYYSYGNQGDQNHQGGGQGWVDERLYNGQNYGRNEAWGR